MCICTSSLKRCFQNRTFNPANCDSGSKDVILAHRMKQLEWVQPVHLEMESLDLANETVVTAIHKARQGDTFTIIV